MAKERHGSAKPKPSKSGRSLGASAVVSAPHQTRSSPKEGSSMVICLDMGGGRVRASFKEGDTFERMQLWTAGNDSKRRLMIPALVAWPIDGTDPEHQRPHFGEDAQEALRYYPAKYRGFGHLKEAMAAGIAQDGVDTSQGDPAFSAERTKAELIGTDLLALAQSFYSYVGSRLLEKAGRANVTLLISVPVRYCDERATRYSEAIQDIFHLQEAPYTLTLRLLDEPTAALFGILTGFPHEISRGTYTVGDWGSSTFDLATMTVGEPDERGVPTIEFQRSESCWHGASRIMDAVEGELRRLLPEGDSRVLWLGRMEDNASDPIASLRHYPRPELVNAHRWEISIARLENFIHGVCEDICRDLEDYLYNILRPARLPVGQHELYLTGGGAAIAALKPGWKRLSQLGAFEHIKFYNTSENQEAKYGSEGNQHVLKGMERIVDHPEFVSRALAPYDLYITSHRREATHAKLDQPDSTVPLRVWSQGDDLRGPDDCATTTHKPYCPILFQLERDGRTKERRMSFDATIYENTVPSPRVMDQDDYLTHVSIDDVRKGREYTCLLDISSRNLSAWIYVWLQPYVLDIRVVIVYRRDGAEVEELSRMSLRQVLGGREFGVTIDETLQDKHDLLYAEARHIRIPRMEMAIDRAAVAIERAEVAIERAEVATEQAPTDSPASESDASSIASPSEPLYSQAPDDPLDRTWGPSNRSTPSRSSLGRRKRGRPSMKRSLDKVSKRKAS